MLFERYPALLRVHAGGRFARTELDIQVCGALIQYITLERRFHVLIPDLFSVQMQVLSKSTSNNYFSTFEFVPDFGRNRQPVLIVKFSFEEIQVLLSYRGEVLPTATH